MTPEQKIKHAIIIESEKYCKESYGDISSDNVDNIYEILVEKDLHWDCLYEIREGAFETEVTPEYSRHYESKSVAMKMPDDSWVGWTYWYGGGKHSDPDSINWMCKAYNLEHEEVEKTVKIHKFKKV